MDKRFLGILVAVALVLTGVFFISNNNKNGTSDSTKGTLTSHTSGSSPAGVTLTEYGDFQCPACGQYYSAVKEVAAKYNTQVVFQFRNFPLFQIHSNAIAGARAAEAAGKQNKYWEFHDKLYEENVTQQLAQRSNKAYSTWTDASDPLPLFLQYATEFGLDTTKFKLDYKSAAVNDLVQADLAEGNRLGIDSTPTFFLNGKKISTPNPTVEAFGKVLDAELAKKNASTTPKDAPEPAKLPAGNPAPEPAATQ